MTKKTFLPLLLATTLVNAPVFADDGFNFGVSNDAQIQAVKPAKAQREKNPVASDHPMLKSAAAGFGLTILGPIGAIGVPIASVMISRNNMSHITEINAFYSGTVVRGKVVKVLEMERFTGTVFGVDHATLPAKETVQAQMVALVLDVDGPMDSDRIMYARKDAGYVVGDIVDAMTLDGVFPGVNKINDKLVTDFNRHIPRVIGLFCKHDNPVCQNDYESSLGVIYRHTDKEFPPSQYLIDPATVAADQVKMRKDEEKKKSAQSSSASDLI